MRGFGFFEKCVALGVCLLTGLRNVYHDPTYSVIHCFGVFSAKEKGMLIVSKLFPSTRVIRMELLTLLSTFPTNPLPALYYPHLVQLGSLPPKSTIPYKPVWLQLQ